VVQKLGGIGPGLPFFDPTAFAAPTGVRFGTSGRNILRGPGAVNLDLGLFRKFTIREKLNWSSVRKRPTSPTHRTSTIQTPTLVPPIFWSSPRRCQISGRFD